MSADNLTATSRAFYERTKSKAAASFFLAAASMLFLGFTSQSGGQSSAYGNLNEISGLPSYLSDAYQSYQGGYGFGAFCFILSFILMVSSAFYISPYVTGSNNERLILRTPQEIDTGYPAQYSNNPAASAPTV